MEIALYIIAACEYIRLIQNGIQLWHDKNCHASVMNKGIKPDFEYCPHCGAKMEDAERDTRS